MAVTTKSSFFELLKQAGVFTSQQLESVRDSFSDVDDPKKIAGKLIQQGKLTRWQAGQLFAGRPQALTLGKYRLIDQLGAGAMGHVYLGEHTQMRRRVAIKTLARKHSTKQSSIDRFLKEARAIAALDHRNIIQAYDVDSEGDVYYLVMEYMEGQDLQRMVEEKGPLPFADIAEYIAQAASGLSHAHEKGLVHRDIKPANLLVDSTGVLKLLDLGVAQMNEDSEDGAGQSNLAMLGTVDYVAPEQAENHSTIDHRADIYALGGTMYFLLSGKAPFPDGSMHQRLLARLQKDPKSILNTRPDAPQGLVRICRKMMARNPADRYQSAQDVVEAVEKYQAEAAAAPAKTPVRRNTAAVARTIAAKPVPGGEPTPPPVAPPLPPSDDTLSSFGDFTISQGRKTAGDATTVSMNAADLRAQTAAQQAALAPSAAASPAARVKHNKTAWIIAGGAFAGMLIMGGVLGFVLTRKPHAAEVAKVEPADAAADSKAAADAANPAAAAVTPTSNDPGNTVAANDPPGQGEPGETNDPANPADPMPKPEDNPMPMPPENPMPPDGTAPTEPPATNPADPPGTTTKPETPEKTPPTKPVEPKPAPKAKPFEGFPKVVSLPEITREAIEANMPPAPKVLGKLHVEKRDAVFVSLYGGDKAGRARTVFALRRGDRGLALRDWELTTDVAKPDGADTTSSSTSGTALATLSLKDDGNLEFTWLEAALADATNAANLGNCVLELQAAKIDHSLALREPVVGDALVISVEKGAPARVEVDIPSMPDAKYVYFEVASMSAQNFGKAITYQPPEPRLDGLKGTVGAVFGEGGGLAVKIDVTNRSRGTLLVATPWFQINGNVARLTMADFNSAGLLAERNVQIQTARVARAKQQNANAQQLKLVQGEQATAQSVVTALTKLQPSVKALEGGQIEYRIVADYGTHRLTLAKSAGAPDLIISVREAAAAVK